jgi:hypothetical protein
MLHPKIVEVSTDQVTGETYVLVRFWKTKAARTRGDPPFLTEDFLMQLRPTGTRQVDPDDPSKGTEVFDRDLEAEIRDNIRRYIVDAERYGHEGDNTSQTASGGQFFAKGRVVRRSGTPIKAIKRDSSDPHGVLAKPEVAALPGKDIDLLAAVGP